MKQENVQKLIASVANYVDHLSSDEFDKAHLVTMFVHTHLFQTISDENKSRMYNMTVAALNEGSEEAMEDAFYIKLQALASGDDELIGKIDYLWNVI